MVTGINHVTLAVSTLERSLDFYADVLGFKPEARWDNGAYLSSGGLWLCLSLGDVSPAQDYTHVAFNVDEKDFQQAVQRIIDAGAETWKDNVSEGLSHYFLDPDGHKLELHCGSLADRLKSVSRKPYAGWVFL